MDGFKQRLIGALVLISLAVILVPMLLDEPHEERTTRSIEIPEEPDFPEIRIEPAQEPVFEDQIESVPEPERPPMSTSRNQQPEQVEPMTSDRRVQSPEGTSRQAAPTPQPDPVPESATEGSGSAQQIEPQPRQETPAVSRERAPSVQPDAGSKPSTEQSQAEKGGYLVQLGSFSSQSNASALKDSVATAGSSSRTTTVDSDGKTFTRVFAGPFPDKESAASAKQKIDSQFGLNSLVIVND